MPRPSFALGGTLSLLASLTLADTGRAGSTTVTATATSNPLGGGLFPDGKLASRLDEPPGSTLFGETAATDMGPMIADTAIRGDTTEVASRPASSSDSAYPLMVDSPLLTNCPAPSGGTKGIIAWIGGSDRFRLGSASTESIPDLGSVALLSIAMAGAFAVHRFYTRRISLN